MMTIMVESLVLEAKCCAAKHNVFVGNCLFFQRPSPEAIRRGQGFRRFLLKVLNCVRPLGPRACATRRAAWVRPDDVIDRVHHRLNSMRARESGDL